MKRIALLLAGVGAVATISAGVFAFGLGGRAEASTFHVDFEAGQDQRDGLTPATAWKHAPGDPEATGMAARTRLQAGDTVIFAANVRYRGSIVVKSSGAPNRPITFQAAQTGASIIDGSEPVPVRPCRSAADCGGALNWPALVRFETSEQATESLAVFSEGGPLRPAQEPDPSDDFYRDEVDDMFDADGQLMGSGAIKLPADIASRMTSAGGSLALWVMPNRVTYRPITQLEGDTARFDPSKLRFYTKRMAKAAVIDHVSLIDQPGEYAVLQDRRTVVAMLPPGSTALSVGSGRPAFDLGRTSHVAIRGLRFENMSDGGRLAPGGVAIFADTGASSDIAIRDNTFRNFVMPRGQGPIILRGVNGLRIVGNTFDTIMLGSGMRLTGSDILIEGNRMRRLGRTGIMLIGTSGVTVQGNHIDDIRGVHGNGLSVYLDNRNVRIVGNTVVNAKQPATFHGDRGKGAHQNNILFANNLFIATPDALGSLISWGAYTRGVTIRNNVILGGRTGLRLSSSDTGVTIANNVVSGLIVAGGLPEGWSLEGNEWTSITFQQRRLASPPKVSISAERALAAFAEKQTPVDVCDVIRRRPIGPPELDAAPGAIGADLRCP
ncbi:right-handed parallel beta-helix repeat-containing protein [Phenylobacterium kunshanense]|uniref:Right handed beta helix domain-containing protein n=1 Tax=Phenylobacterium kunshanense TaxID=1445034 RepID=A0A328BHW2_9CAUL|nr:right-handed parallel beta-helix repeat-containing protein [Phenylobacterium kunshanense]RAK66537.1 hypothetical protein DJ019_09880 [Phenylobacterium kunshanense]